MEASREIQVNVFSGTSFDSGYTENVKEEPRVIVRRKL